MSDVVRTARDYYNSGDADRFYFRIWGGEDIHIGLYESRNEDIGDGLARLCRGLSRPARTLDGLCERLTRAHRVEHRDAIVSAIGFLGQHHAHEAPRACGFIGVEHARPEAHDVGSELVVGHHPGARELASEGRRYRKPPKLRVIAFGEDQLVHQAALPPGSRVTVA